MGETLSLREPDRARFVEVNRTRLRLWCWGDPAAPVVLLAHGAFDHGRMFDDLAPRVAALGFHAVAVDLRGHGDSGRIASGATWNASTIDLCELARVLGDEADRSGQPVGIIGHSMGGDLAVTAVGTAPERFAWAVNMDGLGPPEAHFGLDDLAVLAAQSVDGIERNASRPPKVWASRADMAARRAETNRRLSQAWLDHLAFHGSREVEGGFVWKADSVFAHGIPDGFSVPLILAGYRDATCPVLVLTSTEADGWTEVDDEESARRVAIFPAGRWRPIAGAGHYVHVEQPDATVAEFVAFLDDHGFLPERAR